MQRTSTPAVARAATLAFVAWTLVPAAGASAQCHVVSMPAAFDPPASGIPEPLRSSANSLGISAGAQRLVVRYNYGFVTYSLATPSAPFATAVKDLWNQEGYPKSGDGQSRTGLVALSGDGQRVLVPWTDDVGYGTIVQPWVIGAFGHGGDFPPPGNSAAQSAVAKVGNRYLGFTATNQGLFAADVTTIPTAGPSLKNGIPSERVTGPPNDLTGATAVDTAARSWVVTWSPTRVWVLDVTNAGPSVPGLTTGIVKREHLATALGVTGGGTVSSVSAAAHPVDGALHVLVEGVRFSGTLLSTGVRLFRIDPVTGDPAELGGFAPPTGEWPQAESVLLPFDSELVAFVVHRMSTGGLKLQVRSSTAFTTNLAATVPVFATPGVVNAMKGFRSSGGNAHLYIGDALKTWALSLSCTLPVDPGGTP
ncbi:MAG: hypothetical protein KJ062_17145, partial [Thermoanaerobaculia bacterium]|nr:hypothetical protein [Thermoanaerobaculia bacterium]